MPGAVVRVAMPIDFGSEFSHMDNPLAIIGVETNTQDTGVQFYVEHIQSMSGDFNGSTHGGIKFIF